MVLKNVNKIYSSKDENIIILDNVTIKFDKGKMYSIVGHSGSGKTTLINILGLIDKIDSGHYSLNEVDVNNISEKEVASIRKTNIGFIFQNYNLDEHLTALENVIIPMLINKNILRQERKKLAHKLLKEFDIDSRTNHFPKKLSGGEQQRVAIARALVNNPDYILCDEPTGALDKKNEEKVLKYLKKLTLSGKCVIVVSHSTEIYKYSDVNLLLENGKLTKM